MSWHVSVEIGNHRFEPPLQKGDKLLRVPLAAAEDPQTVSMSVADRFAENGLRPTAAALDILCAAVGAYTADVRIPRKDAHDGWTRDIVLHLPVQDTVAWAAAAPPLERLLRFLTGDHWRLSLREGERALPLDPGERIRQNRTLKTSSVCLFSGGLDSFIGAVDELGVSDQLALVGHHSLGGGPTSSSQTKALAALQARYGEERAPFLKLWVSPPKGEGRSSEITTRGRSILFLALGICVASSRPNGRLVVPENGLISLNVPLTDSRLGSLSTRTTHPYLIALLRQTLAALGSPVVVELPYRFATKGEMLRRCRDQDALADGIGATMSCARPSASRFDRTNPSANRHCGYCVPCLIRRAAVTAALGTDPTPYGRDVLRDALSAGRRSDLRAVKMALARYVQRPPRMADILVPGPVPGTDADLAQYLGVFRRGIEELRHLLE